MILRPMRVSLGDYSYCLVITLDLIRTMLDIFRDFGVKTYRGISISDFNSESAFDNIFNREGIHGSVYYSKGNIQEIEGYGVDSCIESNNAIFKMLSDIAEGVPVAW